MGDLEVFLSFLSVTLVVVVKVHNNARSYFYSVHKRKYFKDGSGCGEIFMVKTVWGAPQTITGC